MRPLNFDSAVAGWIAALGRDADVDLRGIQEDLIAASTEARDVQVESGLHELWRLMRHVDRTDCWRLLLPANREGPDVREEIRSFLAREPERGELLDKVSDAFRKLHSINAPIREDLVSFGAMVRDICNVGLEQQLPLAKTSRSGVSPYLFDPGDAGHRFKRGVRFLVQLAERLEPTFSGNPLFWAVLGPVADALHPEELGGFEARIADARRDVLQERLTSGRADLVDYWLVIRSADPASSERANRGFLDMAAKAPTVALEEFFDAVYPLDDYSDVIPERALMEAPIIWRRILRRSDLSFHLLARAGSYFWEASGFRSGPARALAAYASTLESDPGFSGEIPQLLLAAFRSAARGRQRRLALHFLSLGLLYLGFFAHQTPAEQLDKVKIGRYRLYAFLMDSWDKPGLCPRFPLFFAVEGIKRARTLDKSRLAAQLQKAGRLLNVEATGVEARLSNALGIELWNALDSDGRGILMLAESFWSAIENRIIEGNDYSAVGIHYRRAIEHAWLEAMEDLPGLNDSHMLGRLIGSLLDLGPVGRGILAARFGANSELLDRRFLKTVLELCGNFLNPSAHAPGLTRPECEELRRRLLEDGWLRRILQAVRRVG